MFSSKGFKNISKGLSIGRDDCMRTPCPEGRNHCKWLVLNIFLMDRFEDDILWYQKNVIRRFPPVLQHLTKVGSCGLLTFYGKSKKDESEEVQLQIAFPRNRVNEVLQEIHNGVDTFKSSIYLLLLCIMVRFVLG